MTVSLKRSKDCGCICHKGAVIVHVVACCDAYRPDELKPKQKPETEKPKVSN